MSYLWRFCWAAAMLSSLSWLPAMPVRASETNLETIEIDLNDDDSEIRPRISTDGDQLDIQVYEKPEPETRIEFREDGFLIEQEQKPPQELFELSIPVD